MTVPAMWAPLARESSFAHLPFGNGSAVLGGDGLEVDPHRRRPESPSSSVSARLSCLRQYQGPHPPHAPQAPESPYNSEATAVCASSVAMAESIASFQ